MRQFLLSLSLVAMVAGSLPAIAQDHSSHGKHHGMSQADFARLREVVYQYKTMSDDQIMESMAEMPGNYAWYVSDQQVRGDTGILVLAHGSGKYGDGVFKQSLEPLASAHPVALGFGMAMMGSGHLQKAVDQLTTAGAQRVVVIPAALSRNASVYRQWDYTLGNRDEAAYLATEQIETDAELIFRPVMGSHPLAAQIMLEYASEISDQPAEETLIVVGHGPQDAADNERELAILQQHVEFLEERSGFAQIKAINLQDDAIEAVRSANVAKLRSWIEAASDAGQRVLIVGYLMSTRGIQYKFKEDLKDLDYTLQTKGISSHPLFARWIELSVDEG
jgi:sirohydrochlorin cobaltochelatase